MSQNLPESSPPPDDAPHPMSRQVGAGLLALGVVMWVVIFVNGSKLDKGVTAPVVLIAGIGTWVGLGLVVFPWTNRMIAGFTADANAFNGLGRLPTLWKVWLVLAVVPTVGAFVATQYL